jgi:hypothetical protein
MRCNKDVVFGEKKKDFYVYITAGSITCTREDKCRLKWQHLKP